MLLSAKKTIDISSPFKFLNQVHVQGRLIAFGVEILVNFWLKLLVWEIARHSEVPPRIMVCHLAPIVINLGSLRLHIVHRLGGILHTFIKLLSSLLELLVLGGFCTCLDTHQSLSLFFILAAD
jgi:hypothetical protein